MPTRKPLITESDYQQLQEILNREQVDFIADSRVLSMLHQRLESARIIDDEQVPATVVTMESVVQLRDPTSGSDEIFTLVFPEFADIAKGWLSVIAPVGVSILGRHVGQIIRSRVLSDQRRLIIQEILFQPENDDIVPHPICRVPSTLELNQRHALTL